MQHLKHCIVLSFFWLYTQVGIVILGKTWVCIYISMYRCALTYTLWTGNYKSTHIHTNTGKRTFIGMACKSLPMINLRITFMWGAIFPPKQIICRLTCKCYNWNTRTISKGLKVLFKAQQMPKSQQIYMIAKMMNFLVEWTGKMGNNGQKLLSTHQFLLKSIQTMLDVFISKWIEVWNVGGITSFSSSLQTAI